MSRWQPFNRAHAAITLSGEPPFGLDGFGRGTQLDVTVADHCTRGWVTTPPAGLQDWSELQAVAEARFEAVFHAPASQWCVQADWSADRPFVCSALPKAWLEALQVEAAERGLGLRSIAPQWVRSFKGLPWADLGKAPVALACVFHADGLTALFMQNGVPLDWRQHWCARDDIEQRLRGQALMAGCELPAQAWAVGDVAQGAFIRWRKVVA